MTRHTLIVGFAAAAMLAATGAPVGAQSLAPLTRAKAAATNAVAATNAHTRVMEGDSVAPATKASGQKSGSTVPRKSESPAPERASKPASAPAPHAAATRASAEHGRRGTARAGQMGGGERGEVTLVRESFTYDVDGRRDPFLSLLKTGELRPMISDLKLVTIIYDPAGRSVAILRDLSTKEQYRVKVGQTLGRMRVARIQPKSVTFTLEELGFSRQEVLALNDTTSARSQ
jgi:hypothetical protein